MALAQPSFGIPYKWVMPKDADGATIYLFHGETQVGGYDRFEGYYRPLLSSGAWGEACEPPIAPPVSQKLKKWMAQGVDQGKICNAKCDVYSINGREVTQAQAEKALADGDTFPDDSGYGWLVVICPDESTRKKVTDDWAKEPAVAVLREKTHVWSRPPQHMHMIDHRAGTPLYYAGGNPTIYYQNSGGEVLHRQDDFSPGDFKALRKIDPTYDPKKDVDQRKSGDGVLGGKIPSWALVMIVAGIGAFLLYKNPQPVNALSLIHI